MYNPFRKVPAEIKALLILLFLCIGAFLLSGCGMTNQEIAAHTRYCYQQGMGVRVLENGLGRTAAVECVPLFIKQNEQ